MSEHTTGDIDASHTMGEINALQDAGYLSARQHKAIMEAVRILHRDGADLKVDVLRLTKEGKPKRRATVKITIGMEAVRQKS